MKLENIPADTKTIIDNDFIRGLEPFEYKEFKKFEYPYLSGFYAENMMIQKKTYMRNKLIKELKKQL